MVQTLPIQFFTNHRVTLTISNYNNKHRATALLEYYSVTILNGKYIPKEKHKTLLKHNRTLQIWSRYLIWITVFNADILSGKRESFFNYLSILLSGAQWLSW